MADNIFKRKLYFNNGVFYILVDNARIDVSDADIRRGFITQYDKVYVFQTWRKQTYTYKATIYISRLMMVMDLDLVLRL